MSAAKRIERTVRILGILALACLVASAAAAQGRDLVLGSDGTVFRLQAGSYGELFPEGRETYPDYPVLALDVTSSDGVSERLLVPGTETWDPESSPSLVYEKSIGVLYLLWQTDFNGIHPLFELTSFDGAEWSDVIEISHGPFTRKGSPRLAITREASEGGSERIVLHLVWREEAAGVSLKRYAPIIIDGGSYLGWSPVIDLASFQPSDDGALSDVRGLENALAVRPGQNPHSIVIGFLNPETHRLSTLEVELVPQAVASLADGVRGHIVIIGVNAASHDELAEAAREKVLEDGGAFHESARRYIADEVGETVRQSREALTPEGIVSIADGVRGHIVIIGAHIGSGGLGDSGESQILEIGQAAAGGAPYHYLEVSVVSDRKVPEIDGVGELILSESGRNVIIAWEQDGAVFYRESIEESWSEPVMIELSESLDRETVFQMLEERVRTD
ncbi:MAG: hypothetical protein GY719_18340 [bacterium]|nr:hypothetical protein [bacterium]